MLYLRTFGGLSLENGGRPIVGAAGQRGRLAILASRAYQDDRFQGSWVALARAHILAQLGEADDVVAELKPLLSRPSQVSVHSLRLDPLLAPLREHASFRELLAR